MAFSFVWDFVEILIFSYLAYVAFYNFIFSVSGLISRIIKDRGDEFKHNRILVLIPCYKDQNVILNTAKQATYQKYPKDKFDVVVIADTIPGDVIKELRQIPVKVNEVSFDKSTKVRALNKCLEGIEIEYDALVILDADNIMESEFLRKFNIQFEKGVRVIQGQRLPKNANTEVAILDGLSEKINNHILRKGANNLSLSSSIAGSGFGGEYMLLKSILSKMDSVGGFDKELEILLLEEGVKTKYYQNLIVYDEKVQKSEVFQSQRKRWISSQYFYLNKYFTKGIIALFKGNLSYFNTTILRNLQLPRLINLGLMPIFMIYGYFGSRLSFLSSELWLLLILTYCISIVLSIPGEFYSLKNLKAILKLPWLFFIMFKLLFKLRGANREFIHTPKN